METEDPRRRILINSLSLGAASLLLEPRAALADVTFGDQPARLPPEQSIYRIRGQAFVNGKEASLETRIGPNDHVRTGPNSELIFVVGGHSMLLRENTDISMRGSEPEHDSFIISALRLLTGKLLAVSRNQRTRYMTSTATLGIRGTGIYIEAEPDLTYFCTCYGKTTIQATHDPLSRATVESKHHDRPMFIARSGKSGRHITKAGFRDHTDEELLLIETIVGRTTPFPVPFDGPDPYSGA